LCWTQNLNLANQTLAFLSSTSTATPVDQNSSAVRTSTNKLKKDMQTNNLPHRKKSDFPFKKLATDMGHIAATLYALLRIMSHWERISFTVPS
jgi:hypothetical protein